MSRLQRIRENKSLILWILAFFSISLLISIMEIRNIPYAFFGKAKDANKILESGDTLKRGDVVSLEICYLSGLFADTPLILRFNGNDRDYYIALLDNKGTVIVVSAAEYENKKYLEYYSKAYHDYSLGESDYQPGPLVVTGNVVKLSVEDIYSETLWSIEKKTGLSFDNAIFLEIDLDVSRLEVIVTTVVGFLLTGLFGLILLLMILDLFSDETSENNEQTSIVLKDYEQHSKYFTEDNKFDTSQFDPLNDTKKYPPNSDFFK